MTPNMFVKDKAAPARQLIPERLKAVMAGRIHIAMGAHADDGVVPPSKKICIMEATSYILGYDSEDMGGISDDPPCTSDVITQFLISVNDSLTGDRKRAQLKKIIPEIINTAPTIWRKHKVYGGRDFWTLITMINDRDYCNAERIRKDMIDSWYKSIGIDEDEIDFDYIPMHKILDLVSKLAAVAKFDGRNAKND